MKYLLILFLSLSYSMAAVCQTGNPLYDKTLADSLGADEYGMKSYIFVILKTGTNKIEDKALSDSLFKGHIANINRLADAGKLVVAGPFGKNDKEYRGLFILNVQTTEEAQALLQTDPAIQQKVFDVELISWYGSAALPMYLDFHKKIEKEKI